MSAFTAIRYQAGDSFRIEPKDYRRIHEIIAKANGDHERERELARQMAYKITTPAKARRRAAAADEIGCYDLAVIFFNRYQELKKRGY